MKFARIGTSGLKITQMTYGTALTIGTEKEDTSFAKELLDTAWNYGVRSFDTSNNYGYGKAEELLGEVLKNYPRHEYILSTKGSWPIGESVYEKGLSRKHILWAFEESRKRLQTDYIDVYYAHRYDPDAPIEEVVRTFNTLIESGKIRYWATSEWPLEAIVNCHKICDRLGMERPVLDQFIYSFAVRKSEINGVKPYCDATGVGTLGFSPLCQGYLTGKYKNGIPKDSRVAKGNKLDYHKTSNFYEQNKVRIDSFLEICEKFDLDATTVALQWTVRRGIYPVVGASTPEQLKHNILAFDTELPEEIWPLLENVNPVGR